MAVEIGTEITQTNVAERDARGKAREARAERYFRDDLKGQRDWYDHRASAFKNRAQLLSLAVLVAGALTSFVQVFGSRAWAWVPAIAAFLGGVVVVAEGWQRIARYAESWRAYRIASERMRREWRLYVNGAGEYREITDEEGAFLRFVENIEAILAEEQQIFWQHRGGEPPAGQATNSRQAAIGEDGEHRGG